MSSWIAIAGITSGCRCECIKRKSSPQKCASHICGEDFLPIWLETSVCDGADKVTKLIKQKEKAITRVHKKARKDKTSYEIVQTQ